ncbi:hypothetical protein GCM10008967_38600 [Bacillus carboniphilus]|uniref:KTSC domain-containing protein n=1 Tax=Bacillus carboniphilus TaxID=86663 RepID=A0ABP3GFU0_9BACI
MNKKNKIRIIDYYYFYFIVGKFYDVYLTLSYHYVIKVVNILSEFSDASNNFRDFGYRNESLLQPIKK